jgi:coenzyme F420-reducing hydrogenase delta subunit
MMTQIAEAKKRLAVGRMSKADAESLANWIENAVSEVVRLGQIPKYHIKNSTKSITKK